MNIYNDRRKSCSLDAIKYFLNKHRNSLQLAENLRRQELKRLAEVCHV